MQADVLQLEKFVVKNHKELAKWTRQVLRQWLAFHVKEGFILAVSDGLRIAGLTVVRPVMKPQDGEDGWTFDYEGPCLYVAAMIAKSNEAFRALAVCIHHRFGVRPLVAWNHRRSKKLMVHNSCALANHVFHLERI